MKNHTHIQAIFYMILPTIEEIPEKNSSGDKLYILDENKKCSINFVHRRSKSYWCAHIRQYCKEHFAIFNKHPSSEIMLLFNYIIWKSGEITHITSRAITCISFRLISSDSLTFCG
jgi:hypothetical protein